MQTTNWQAIFFDFLVGAFLIFALFRLIQYLIPVLFAGKKKYRRILPMLPLAETGAWLLFLSWYVFKFAEIASIYALIVGSILLILIFWISKFFLKDLIAGMFIRSSGRYKEGEMISHENFKGLIRKFGLQALEVESQDGQIIFIPYHKLLDSYSSKNESEEQSSAFTFKFDFSSQLSREENLAKIKSYIISLPWSSIQKTPIIQLLEHGNHSFSAEVTAFPIEKQHGRKIEQLTLEQFLHPTSQ